MKYRDLNGNERDIQASIVHEHSTSSINPKIRWEEICLVIKVDGKQKTKQTLDYREKTNG